MRQWLLFALVLAVICANGCGGGGSSTPAPSARVSVFPTTATLRVGDPQHFQSTVSGTSNLSVTWTVNGIAGGDPSVGTIDAAGNYLAPATLPSPNSVEVKATSVAESSKSAASQVTLLNPIAVVALLSPPTLTPAASFTLNIVGAKFVSGAQATLGASVLTTTFVDSSHLTATGTAPAVGVVNLTVSNPAPDGTASVPRVVAVGTTSERAAIRFLEQSTFGPTTAQLVAVESAGMQKFLSDQFAASVSAYPEPDPAQNVLFLEQNTFFKNAINSQASSDQLRQRVVFALNQIWVVSGNKVGQPRFFTPYLRLLAQDSFTNYRTLMEHITLNPAMGLYLDMVNNAKPDPIAGTHANENYAREFLQLFTIGPNQLNADGTPVLQNGGFVATYDQETIQALARAFTGWTFHGPPPNCAVNPYNDYFGPDAGNGPMLACDSNHDTDPKSILGSTLPTGQTAQADLDGALDIIFNHPNLPPFVAQRFIRNFVTSNPSPAYVTRVATAFANGVFTSGGKTFGTGQRGDMQALIAAMLLDSEARRGDNAGTENPGDGHLREPTLLFTNLLRTFNGATDGQSLADISGAVGETVFYAPSVFNFYSPEFAVPLTNPPLSGPEFQLFNTANALTRANLVEAFIFSSVSPGTRIDLSSMAALSNDPATLVEALNQKLLHGTMSSNMRSAILVAVNTVPDSAPLARAQTAAYLIMSSSQYQVQR